MAQKKFSIKQLNSRNIAWIVVSILILALAYIYIGGEFGLVNHWRLSQKKATLEREIVALKKQQDSLRIAIERLKSDSSYIAKIAREKYNMGLPDEEIIRIINKK